MRFVGCLLLFFAALGNAISQNIDLSGTLLQSLDSNRFDRLNFGLFRLVPYVAPSFSPEVSLMFSGGGLLTFKSQMDDQDLNFSTIPFSAGVSTNGSFYFQANHFVFWPNDRIRSSGEFHLRQMPDNYFGVGYNQGVSIVKSDTTTAYNRDFWSFSQKVMFRVVDKLYAGVVIQFNNTRASSMNPMMLDDPHVAPFGNSVFNAGLGCSVEYDSRDFPQNAYQGLYAGGSIISMGRWLGSDANYYVADVDLRRYFTLSRPANTLAVQVKGTTLLGGDTLPWSAMPVVGGNIGLRGYTLGRFRDQSLLQAIVEYRYRFMKNGNGDDGQSISRWGYVFWLGTGSVASSFMGFKHWLPNGGIGLRYEVARRMNLRLDFGVARKEQNAYITFSESF